jgi:glycosyltransferase involved in cell wall biosynthesis
LRSAIVHDWLTSQIGGAEKVLAAIHKLFPSPIYTLVKNLKKLEGSYFQDLEIHSSWIQKLPVAKTKYKNYLPLFPLAIEQFDLKEYDLIISSSHCAAKGVSTSPKQLHICYCHTPMRYAWDMLDEYSKELRGVKRALAKWILHRLRSWDVNTSKRVDHFIANSRFVAMRIQKFYGRSAEVIYPPVDTIFYCPAQTKK